MAMKLVFRGVFKMNDVLDLRRDQSGTLIRVDETIEILSKIYSGQDKFIILWTPR